MTPSTLELIETHIDEYEIDETRTYKLAPRPHRRRQAFGRQRRKASLSINGRNTSRSTRQSFYRATLATKIQTGDVS